MTSLFETVKLFHLSCHCLTVKLKGLFVIVIEWQCNKFPSVLHLISNILPLRTHISLLSSHPEAVSHGSDTVLYSHQK